MKKEIEEKIRDLEHSLKIHEQNYIATNGALQFLKDWLKKEESQETKKEN